MIVEDLAGGLLRTVLMVTFLWSPPVGLSVGLTFLLAVTRKNSVSGNCVSKNRISGN